MNGDWFLPEMNDDWFLQLSDETSDEDEDIEKGTYLSCYLFNALSFKSSVLVEVKLVVSNLKYIFMALGHVQFRSILSCLRTTDLVFEHFQIL